MRIAFIAEPYIPVPPEKYGGTERVIYYLIKGLLERGHKIILLAPGDSKVGELVSSPDFKLIPIVRKHTFFGRNVTERDKIKKRVYKAHSKVRIILKKIRSEIDIIHSHKFDLKDFQDFPNLTTLHSAFSFSKLRYFEKRKGLYYVSISENQQEAFPDLQYVGVCYNGLDPKEFPFVKTPQNYLCFVGRFDTEKNPHLAIEFALKTNMKIKLAGKLDWRGQDYFKEMIKPHLNNPLVEYLGEIGMKEKTELISNAVANLHPTGFREPFGLTVLEAGYCGTPTMAIKAGSMPELIEDGRTGLLVEDFVEGYHRIGELVGMDRKYISVRSRNLFNYKTMARQYGVAYEKVIEIFKEMKSVSARTQKKIQKTRDVLRGIWKES